MGARFNSKERDVALIMRKHWKAPSGQTIRWIAKCLEEPRLFIVACRNGAAIVRQDDPLPPDSIHLKDTSIGIMYGMGNIFELSPVEFKYVNKRWWEAKNNG